MKATARTGNSAVAYEHSENHLVEFFSKAGSMFVGHGTHYGNESSALDLFKNAWRSDNFKSMQLAMWLRDCRGGAGNRSGFRAIINWLAHNHTEWLKANIALIPKYGRWDDMFALYNTPCEKDALTLWSGAITSTNPSINGLAAKWADRQDAKLRAFVEMSPKAFRKMLVAKTKVVETAMCQGNWNEIDYNGVPSVAGTRYANAFRTHDENRYNQWRKDLANPEKIASGEVKVNAATLFPHDIVRMVRNTILRDSETNVNNLAEAQLKAMPNYFEGSNERIMSILDFSGSMDVAVAGEVTRLDVALSLGLYCSEKVGSANPFYRKVIPFSTTSKLVSWNGQTLVQAIKSIPNGWVGSTNIKQAMRVLLDAGRFFNATKEQMPSMLLIVSDMQFDAGVTDHDTPVEESMREWIEAGYNRPKIVYWNVAGYANQPATVTTQNVGLVSGFSPSILQSVLKGKDFSPFGIMNDTIEKYPVVAPKA